MFPTQFFCALLLTLLAAGAAAQASTSSTSTTTPSAQRVIELTGDVRITSPTVWRDAHVKIKGNLILAQGGRLSVERSTVELLCEHSRQYMVRWEGGWLDSLDSTLGGSLQNGVIGQTCFELLDGDWHSTNTTIRYCYGITFSYEKVGRLRATNLMRGPNPDTIIMSGRGDVVLRDSAYDISLTTLAAKGGRGDFDLPTDTPLTRVFDKSNVPGADWRLEMVNSKVNLWFLFAQIGSESDPPAEFVLRRCPALLPSVMGANIKGKFQLPCAWPGVEPNYKHPARAIPPRTSFKLGNVTWRTLEAPANLTCWGAYFYGDQTDLTLTGPTLIAELILWEGKLRLEGTPGQHDIWAKATTIEVGRTQDSATPEPRAKDGQSAEAPPKAELIVRNACVGAFEPASAIKGQVTAHHGGLVRMENVRLSEVLLMTKENGRMEIKGARREGDVRLKENGGRIRFIEEMRKQAAKKK